MHRSGTSAVTGSLSRCGFYVGPTDRLIKPNEENPKGFFESYNIMQFNDDLLTHLRNSTWDEVNFLPEELKTAPYAVEFEKRLHELIAEDYKNHDKIVIKDPRISLVLPVFVKVLSQTHKVRLLYIERNKDNVVNSLMKRNNFSNEKAKLLYDLYKNYAEYYIKAMNDKNLWKLQYEHFIQEPANDLQECLQRFGLLEEILFEPERIVNFVDPKLNRSISSQK